MLCMACVCPRRTGIEFKGPAKLLLSARPIPVKGERDIAERGMSLRKRVVQFNGFGSGGLGPWHHLERRFIKCAQTGVSISQARISEGVLWVVGEGLLKVSYGLIDRLRLKGLGG